jgi:plasmid rolling circle replication initiator protein Rep
MPNKTVSSDYLTDLSEKDKPWDIHRGNTSKVQKLYKSGKYDRYAERLDDCSNTLEFDIRTDEDGSGTFKLKSAKFCRVRFCPTCQWRRTMKWQAKIFQALPKITEAYPTHRWLFMTLTVKNCNMLVLRETIADMNKSFVRLSQLKIFPAIGWIKNIEVTRNPETNEAHPHIHAMLLVPSSYFGGNYYITHDKWRSLWQESARLDYVPQVNIQAVKNKNKNDEQSDIQKQVLEMLKYSVKEDDLVYSEDWLLALTTQLHKTRSISIGGVLKDYLKAESEKDDLVNIDEDDYSEEIPEELMKLYFGWRERQQRYKRI